MAHALHISDKCEGYKKASNIFCITTRLMLPPYKAVLLALCYRCSVSNWKNRLTKCIRNPGKAQGQTRPFWQEPFRTAQAVSIATSSTHLQSEQTAIPAKPSCHRNKSGCQCRKLGPKRRSYKSVPSWLNELCPEGLRSAEWLFFVKKLRRAEGGDRVMERWALLRLLWGKEMKTLSLDLTSWGEKSNNWTTMGWYITQLDILQVVCLFPYTPRDANMLWEGTQDRRTIPF